MTGGVAACRAIEPKYGGFSNDSMIVSTPATLPANPV